jgi:rubrerythrin
MGWGMTRCPECGWDLEQGMEECPNCGAILGDYEEFEEFGE